VGWKNVRWQNRAHFFGVSAQLMRKILVDFARSRSYAKRGAGARVVSLDVAPVVSPAPAQEILVLDEALQRLAAIDPRKSQIVELRFFGGLSLVRWNPNGKELFYIALDGQLMAVPIQFANNSQPIKPDAPIRLFPTNVGPAFQGNATAQYIVSSDGHRFLMNTLIEEGSTSPITMILNWKPKS
jgi:hypothetical protein